MKRIIGIIMVTIAIASIFIMIAVVSGWAISGLVFISSCIFTAIIVIGVKLIINN